MMVWVGSGSRNVAVILSMTPRGVYQTKIASSPRRSHAPVLVRPNQTRTGRSLEADVGGPRSASAWARVDWPTTRP